jgi:hypothetical protein
MGHVGGYVGIGQQISKPAPAVGGFEHHLDQVRLELAEAAQELGGGVADPSGHHDLTRGIQGDHVCALAVQVHTAPSWHQGTEREFSTFRRACRWRRQVLDVGLAIRGPRDWPDTRLAGL